MSSIGTTAFWVLVGLATLVATGLVAFAPNLIAPRKGLSPAAAVDILDLQNKVRQTFIQITGGFAFLFSIFMALTAQDSSNKDLKAKYDRETAELFVKAVESSTPEALYSLAYVAQRDSAIYHDTIYRILSSLIRTLARAACQTSPESAERPKARSKIEIALQLVHERNVAEDPAGARYNLEHACLNDVDLGIQMSQWGKFSGLKNVRLSGATMLRVDFTRAELQNAELMGITAGDWNNPGWAEESQKNNLHQLEQDGSPKWKALRRRYIAHFIDANLTDARFDGAGLEGADFSGAKLSGAHFERGNISRTNFRGAQHLTANQLRVACVGHANDPKEVEENQPILTEPLKSQVAALGNIPGCAVD